VHNFFYVNTDTCELGFQNLSAPASEGEGLVLGESTGDMVKQYFFFCQYQWWGGEVCSSCRGGAERGCYRCIWLQILVSYSHIIL
jgi:hypothetical protein